MDWRFALAGLVLTGGCSRGPMPPPLPPPASPAAAPWSTLDGIPEMPRLGPSDKAISAAYREYQRRRLCPAEATCGTTLALPVVQADCSPQDSVETMRCGFIMSARPYGKQDLYRCEAMFQNARDVWRIVRMTAECEGAIWRKLP